MYEGWREPENRARKWDFEKGRAVCGSFLFDIAFFLKSLAPETEMKAYHVEIKGLKRACIQSFVECSFLSAR